MKNKSCRISIMLLFMAFAVGICAGCTQEEMKSTGAVRMATVPDYPPYAYMYQGKLTGIDVELGEMIAKEAGREFQIVNAEFSELVGLVGAGKADMAACALAVTAERRNIVAFSDPYEFAGLTFLVRLGENIRYLTDMRDKTGFRIGADTGSTGYILVDKFLKKSGMPIRIIAYSDNRKAVEGLQKKENDAVILDPLVARCLQMEHPEELEILRDQLNHEEFAVAVSLRNPQLLAAANRVIHRLWESGELSRLVQKHLKQSLKIGEHNAP